MQWWCTSVTAERPPGPRSTICGHSKLSATHKSCSSCAARAWTSEANGWRKFTSVTITLVTTNSSRTTTDTVPLLPSGSAAGAGSGTTFSAPGMTSIWNMLAPWSWMSPYLHADAIISTGGSTMLITAVVSHHGSQLSSSAKVKLAVLPALVVAK